MLQHHLSNTESDILLTAFNICVFLANCQDWFGDDYASEWSYLSNRMRCAARLARPTAWSGTPERPFPVEFGGAIVPRAGRDGRKAGKTGASVGTPDLMMRALTLVGNGAKHIWYFAFGPEPLVTRTIFVGHLWPLLTTYNCNLRSFLVIATQRMQLV